MADALALLRLLEPIVRPDGREGSSREPSRPIEGRSFESLLAEAAQVGSASEPKADGGAEPVPEPANAGLLKPLARIDQIENASLRQIVAGGSGTMGP